MQLKFKILLLIIIITGFSFFIRKPIIKQPVTIPKIIHYIWVGSNEPPETFNNILASWKKYAPDYQIKRWDETNCDMNANNYIRNAYEQKAWAWVSDYCRFVALNKEGGIYLDIDHELKASLDDLLAGADRVFTYQANANLSASFIATKPNDPVVKNILSYYDGITKFNWDISPHILTLSFKKEFPFNPLNNTFYNKNGTILWPTNIAMIDFGGGENKATHYYAATNIIVTSGAYYNVFLNEFLQHNTIKICEPENKLLIFSTPDTVYTYKENQFADVLFQTNKKLILKWLDTNTVMTYKYENNCYRLGDTDYYVKWLKYLPPKITQHILTLFENH